ncbi:DUF4383 domain-containing protein [Plantactinospora sp. B6F1]|uniref:DUF4383 domain-containing protein n=1 Tax=Plantactinospora sp. B6F1 TaxID=3158971 RepID=UPI00102B284B
MAHIPINHPARPIYRVLAGLIGLYIVVFGIFGLFETAGDDFFSRSSHWVLGLRTNLAFATVSVVFGLVVLAGAVLPGNFGHLMNLAIGVVFLVVAIVMMTVLQTEANILNFSMSTVVVSMLFGLVLLATGLYDKVGPPELAEKERETRSSSSARTGR